MHSPAGPSSARPAVFRSLTFFALAIAACALALWIWSLACRFPSFPWNDERLAPSIALAQGRAVYPTADTGVINTWTYGPLPLFFFWPASLASSAAGALQVAAIMNVAIALLPIAWVCFALPAPEGGGDTRVGRIIAFALGAALWPEWQYLFHVSDNLAVACGLAGNLLLLRSTGARGLWAAAVFASAAVACKQIAIGIPLAQVLWLALTTGIGSAGRHALRCGIAVVVMAAIAIAVFGVAGLRFTLFELPARFGWVADPAARLREMWPHLVLHLGLPAVVMIVWRAEFRRGTLLLAALAWLCTLPFGIAGLMKTGGRMNSVHSFLLWLPLVLAWAAVRVANRPRAQVTVFASAVLAAVLACGHLGLASELSIRPRVAAYREAERFAPLMRGRVWFPLHPLITLYSEHRYYHDEDGLYVRSLAGLPIATAQLRAHLPPEMSVVALQEHLSTWGIARQLLPANAAATQVGSWTLWHASGAGTPP